MIFRLKPLVDDALNMLEKEGVLERVNSSLYATPIVPVLKKNGTIRICGDYSHLFIGMIPFYSRFIKNISEILHPLYELLSDSVKFVWTIECKSAFEIAKKYLHSITFWFTLTPIDL